MRSLYHFKKMRSRFTFWFMVIAIVPLIIATIIIYKQREENIKHNQFQKLISIRDLKVKELNNWLDERIGDIRTVSDDPEIVNYLTTYHTRSKQDMMILTQKAEALLQRYITHYSDYLELFLIDAQSGRVILSTNRNAVGADKSSDDYFTVPIQTQDLTIKDIYRSKTLGNKPGMSFSIPVFSKHIKTKNITGILVARIDLENTLYESLLNRTGLGKTGETLIVNKNLYALNELRYFDNAPLHLHITAKPAMAAAAGKTGIIEVADYRGEPVLAAYTYIPRTGWGFVAKQDQKEIYATIGEMLINLFILVLIIAGIIYILSVFLSRIIIHPILNMVTVSQRISAGDFSARNKVNTEDETAILARSINELSESTESRIIISTGIGEILATFVNAETLKDLGNRLIQLLTRVTHSSVGVLYILNDDNDQFEPFASMGFLADKLTGFRARSREGALSQVLATKTILFTSEIPGDTAFIYKTILGTALPKEIVYLPVIVKEKVGAVIALASLTKYPERIKDMIQESWSGINTGFTSLMNEEEIRKIAAELMDKNQELEELAEEFKGQADELQEQNIELVEQRKQVESANQLKSQFLTNMSHELRTPLNAILSLSGILRVQSKDRLNEEELNYLEIVERNGRLLLNLINDILDLSKIESGQMDVNINRLSLPAIINDLVESFKPLSKQKGITLELDIPEDLPPIDSDEFLIQRILQNILGNAIKFTEQGGVTVSVIPFSDSIRVQVVDTGIGIAAEDLPNIFDEFRQVDGSPSRRFEGTGLGLAIAKRSAQLIGGDIIVESVEGRGTTGTIILPLKNKKKTRSKKIVAAKIKPPLAKKVLGRKPLRLLIVEDQEPVILQLKLFMKQAGYQVDVASGGQEAIDYCKKTRPDGIILDLMMPDVDGFAVLEEIRSHRKMKHLPVLILTAKDLTAKDRKRLRNNHIQQLVQKGDINQITFLKKIDFMFGIDREPIDPPVEPVVTDGRPRPSTIRENPIILLIEDNPDNLITLKAIIPSDYTILEAMDGKTGLAMIQEHKPDLVLMDIMLPKMDGFTVLKNVRADQSVHNILVFAVTAKAMKGDKEKILQAGFDAYYSKPLDSELLQNKIEAVLKN